MNTDETWAMREIDLETFKALDRSTRHLILRLLDSPTDRDWAALAEHPQGKALASWLLMLPAYAATPYIEDDTAPVPHTEEVRARAREAGFVRREDGTWDVLPPAS